MIVNYQQVINFWFGKPEERDYGKPRQFWFVKNAEFDCLLISQFSQTYQQAIIGKLNEWQEQPLSCLALIIVLDQFPRNMFRGEPQAFATDSQALELAKYAIAKSFDRTLLPVQRWFIYLPFEHSENLADQKTSLQLFSTLDNDPESKSTISYAQRHYDVIERFGRFPHRNHLLGRENTPEETVFLQQPGSSF